MRDRGGKVGGHTLGERAGNGTDRAATTPGKRTLVQQSPAAYPTTARAAPAVQSGPVPPLPSYASIQRIFGDRIHAKPGGGAPDVHAAAANAIAGPSTQLPHLEQIQRSFGKHDVGHIQAHMGPEAKAGSCAMGAEAFATGDHVAFASEPSLHIAAHEAAHVVQQHGGVQLAGGIGEPGDTYEQHADQVADLVVRGRSAEALLDQHAGDRASRHASRRAEPALQRQPAEGPVDAGIPLPAGVVDPSPRLPAASLNDAAMGAELQHAEELAKSGSVDRENEIEDELEKRVVRTSFATAPGGSPTTPANTQVTTDVAVRILENVAKGEPPFKPELGKGGASWFVTEGNPYVGIDPAKNITVEVEVTKSSRPVRFAEPDLLRLLDEAARENAAEAEAVFRQRFGLDANTPLTAKVRKSLARFQRQFAESKMWDKVGQRVRSSTDGVGEVVLQQGSRFSRSGSGKFAVVTDATKIHVKGGVEGLVQHLAGQGVSAEPPVLEAAEALAKRAKWAGRVRGVFRYGGRILIVVGVAADIWKVYHAQDKVKAVVESAGGWAGATAGAAAFATWFAPGDAAGPWAWAAHGVGTLIAGGVGYWAGSTTTRTIYELVVEN